MSIRLNSGPEVEGAARFQSKGTVVPHVFLQNIIMTPTPFSLSSLTVSLNASDEQPVAIWNKDNIIYLREAKTYTWVAGSNTVLDSTGAETTVTGSTLGVWYFYAYVNSSDEIAIIPSQTAPSGKDSLYGGGFFGHPGASADKAYTYVGHITCDDASTPGFLAFTKEGYYYVFTEADKREQPTTDTSYAALGFTGAEALPTHPGVTVGGYIETAAGDTVKLAYDSNGSGVILATGATGDVGTDTFSGMPLNSGDLYALHGTAAGDVHITSIKDIR